MPEKENKDAEEKNSPDIQILHLLPNKRMFQSMLKASEITKKLETEQRRRCKNVQLPQIHWTKRKLPLEDLYINLKLLKSGGSYHGRKSESMQLEELFDQIDGKDPVRILIEGGPGYGKSTLCLKLLNDWRKERYYISSKFKLIFLFKLRNFKENDSLDEVLKRECEILGVSGNDGIKCIEAFTEETLLILDGFDEMNENCKSEVIRLIQKRKYPSMFVVITSRRGMFEMEKEKQRQQRGAVRKIHKEEKEKSLWNKTVLITGVKKDNIVKFLKKYFNNCYQKFELEINSIINGEMRKVFQCPLFLMLLAMLLEDNKIGNVNSKTALYKEFFNFVIKRNLIREKELSRDKDVDIFGEKPQQKWFQLVNQFGKLAIDYLCENKLIFEEQEIIECCKNNVILKLGFLAISPEMKVHKKENLYQPIHKSFLEFMAAFAMWNLFKTDENQFRKEIKQIGKKGLKPTNDSLFYPFLGGFMNSKAYVLFQSITYPLWFNIESLSFTNILLEIQDVHPFFSSVKPMLDSFIPSIHNINGNNGVSEDFYQSEIYSLILKYSSKKELIKVLQWNSSFTVRLSHELNVEYLQLHFTGEVSKIFSNENKDSIKCQNIICKFPESFERGNWENFVFLMNLIHCEKVHFHFDSKSKGINFLVLQLLHEELTVGRWEQKTIDRVRFEMNKDDDIRSLSLLVDLVERKKINEGVYLWITRTNKERQEKDNNVFKMQTENLFNSIMQSETIKECVIRNDNDNFSLPFTFNGIRKQHLKSLYFYGSLNILSSNEKKTEKCSVQELTILSLDDKKDFNLILNFQEIEYLNCTLNSLKSLIENEWPGLEGIKELTLSKINHTSINFLDFICQLRNVSILTLDFSLLQTFPPVSKRIFINCFSSLHLSICEFVDFHNLELFSFFTEVLMEGLKKKEKSSNSSKRVQIDSDERKNVRLQELVIYVEQIGMGFNELKQCNGILSIQTMLKNQHLGKCCWAKNYSHSAADIDQLEFLFPSSDNFRISREVDGINRNSSRRSQFEFCWFKQFERFSINYSNSS